MKKFLSIMLVGMGSLTAAGSTGTNQTENQQIVPDPGAAHTEATPQHPCAMLSDTEQHFAKQLNPQNRALFCTQFTEEQRQTSMQKATEPDATGNLISADQAVESVSAASPLPTSPSGEGGTGNPSTNGEMPEGCPA